ncbi:hypothetical protein F2P79_024956 [Pimephales promelas]|nr:hypothetical protein F2P79_024956 [Pimephales promelas]
MAVMASGVCGARGSLVAILVYMLFLNVLGFRFDHRRDFNGYSAYVRETFDNRCGCSVNTDNKLFGYGSAALITSQTHVTVRNRVRGRQQADAFGTILSICLLLAGDIHQCPGPNNSQMKRWPNTRCCSVCPNCGKAMRINAKAVACDFCDAFVHIQCGNITSKIYDLAVRSNSDIPLACNRCCLNEMCHANVIDCLEESMHCSGDSLDDARNDCEAVFDRKGLHFIQINARSLLPKLEEARSEQKWRRSVPIY